MSQHKEDDFGQESFASRRQRAFIREKMARAPKEDDFGQENFRGKIRERYEHEEEMPSGSVRGREPYKVRENAATRRPGYDVQQAGQIATPNNASIFANRLQEKQITLGPNGLSNSSVRVRMEPRSGSGDNLNPSVSAGGRQATVRTNQAGQMIIPSNNADTVASVRAAQSAGRTGSSITTLTAGIGEPFAKKPSRRFMAKKREGMAPRGVVRENMGHTGGPPAHIIDHVDEPFRRVVRENMGHTGGDDHDDHPFDPVVEGFRRAAPRGRVMGRQMRERMMVRPAPRKNTMVEQYKNANVKSNMRKQYGL